MQARLGPDLFGLFESFRQANNLDSSQAARILIARGLWRETGGDPGDVDEVAFMAAYYNASQRFVGEMRKVLTGTPLHDMMRAVAKTTAKSLGVRYER